MHSVAISGRIVMCKKFSEIVTVSFCVNQLVKKAWIISQGTLVSGHLYTLYLWKYRKDTAFQQDSNQIFQNGILIIFLKILPKTLTETVRPSITCLCSLPSFILEHAHPLLQGHWTSFSSNTAYDPGTYYTPPSPSIWLALSLSPFRAQLKWSFLRSACLTEVRASYCLPLLLASFLHGTRHSFSVCFWLCGHIHLSSHIDYKQ